MAFVLKYHRLFEVRITHAFYLRDDVAFYNMTDEDQANELMDTNYNILNDLEIIPTKACKKLLAGYHLRFKASPTGFIVGVETETSENNPLQVKPKISIEEGTIFHFRIKVNNTDWINFTNQRLTPAVNGKFYFDNFENLPEKTAPSLSLKPITHQSKRRYEMGEIVSDGGQFYRAIKMANGSDSLADTSIWEDITADFKNFVNYRDRQLVAPKFPYRVNANPGPNVQNIDFTLRRPDNSIAKTIAVSATEAIDQYPLDFSDEPAGNYQLQINSINAYQDSKSLQVNENLYDPYDWGLVAIAHQAGLGDFRLLEANGDLRVEGPETQHPIFEIRLKNRQTYWKYILHPVDAAYTPPVNPEFEKIAGQIFTISPQALSRFYVEKILPATAKKIPNPSDLLVRLNSGTEKYLSEIRLSRMDL